MTTILKNFRSFVPFPQELKENVKCFHVFEFRSAYCVTNDNKVYGFGDNIREYLGYNENNDNKSYVLIQELCDKSIEQFFGLLDFSISIRKSRNH